jgi:hypothetical protein
MLSPSNSRHAQAAAEAYGQKLKNEARFRMVLLTADRYEKARSAGRLDSRQENVSNPEACDAVVLGSGEAGKILGWTPALQGKRVAVIERRYIGGSCPNIACLPSQNVMAVVQIAMCAGLPYAGGPGGAALRGWPQWGCPTRVAPVGLPYAGGPGCSQPGSRRDKR